MATSGPNFPGSTSTESFGTYDWTNAGNITADDTSYATTADPFNNAEVSYYLKGTNFGFSIPSGATINGIEVVIARCADVANDVYDDTVALIKGGTVSGSNLADGNPWNFCTGGEGAGITTVTYGGASSLWGLSWTHTDINASNFGVAMACNLGSGAGTVRVDYYTVTIYYTEGSGNNGRFFAFFE